MKKICFVTTVSTTLKAFIIDMADFLHENGFEISFICDHDKEFEKTLPPYIKYFPVKMRRGINLDGAIAVLKMYLIFKREKFDIIQFSTPNASLYAAIASYFARVKVRLYCQWGILYVGFSGCKRALFKFLEKVVCKLSTTIKPDSHGNLAFSIYEGLYNSRKGSVVWNGSANGVNLEKFNVTKKHIWRSLIRENHSIEDDCFVFGFIGRLTRDKGINELLSASKILMNRYPNFKVMILGDKENNSSVNQQTYEWSRRENRIIYCGVTDEVEKYISSFDVLVLPSYREGFGTVIIEAGAMKVPSISTDIPGPNDAIINNQTGILIKMGSVNSLINSMEFLINNKIIVQELGNNAYEYVVSNYEQKRLWEYIMIDRINLIG